MVRLTLALTLALAISSAGLMPSPATATPAATILVQIDNPSQGEQHMAPGWIAGWAVDSEASDGTGISQVAVYLDGDPSSGAYLGDAQYGGDRADVAAALGNPAFRFSGFTLTLVGRNVSPGEHSFSVVAMNNAGGTAMASVSQVTVTEASPATTMPVGNSFTTPPPPPTPWTPGQVTPNGQLQLNATLSNVSFLMGQNYYNALPNYNGYLYPGLTLPNGTVVNNGSNVANGQFAYNGTMTAISPYLTPFGTPSNVSTFSGAYNYSTALPGGTVVNYGTPNTYWNGYNWGTLNTPTAAAVSATSLANQNLIAYQPYGAGYRLGLTLPTATNLSTNPNWAQSYTWQGNAAVQATLVARVALNGQPIQGAQVTYQGYNLPRTGLDGLTTGTVMFPFHPDQSLQGEVTATYNGMTTTIPLIVDAATR